MASPTRLGRALPTGRGGWHDDGVDWLLAQVNIARMLAPLDSPQLADFVAALDPVNAAADAAPGFVWRLQTEDGNATAVQAFEWDRAGRAGVLVNMSVWESVEALAAYVYSDTHRQVLKRRSRCASTSRRRMSRTSGRRAARKTGPVPLDAGSAAPPPLRVITST
jgi:heme-degrading monooxygenase HmoA